MSAPASITASSIMRSLPSSFDQTSLDRIANLEPLAYPHESKANPKDPILIQLYKNKSIPQSFSFTEAEEGTLKSIFAKWHLDTKFTLFDILGLEIYSEFERICGAYAEKQPLLETVSGSLFKALFLHHRLSLATSSKSRRYVEKYLGTFSVVETSIKDAYEKLKKVKKFSFENYSDLQLKNRMIKAVDERMAHLQSCLDVFFKCMNSPFRKALLTDNYIGIFGGTEQIEIQSAESLAHFRSLAKYYSALFRGLAKSFPLVRYVDLSDVVKDINRPVDFLLTMQSRLKSKIIEYNRLNNCVDNDLYLVERGILPYSRWSSPDHVKLLSCNPECQEDLREMLWNESACLRMVQLFLEDLGRLLEFKVLKEAFPDQYIPQTSVENRLVMNVIAIKKEEVSKDTDPFRLKIRNELRKIFPSYSKYKELAECIKTESSLQFKDWFEPKFVHEASIEILKLAKNDLENFFSSCVVLGITQKEIMAKLTGDEYRPLEQLQKIAFEECLPICRLAMIFRDAKFLLGSTDLDFDIPVEIADFIQLEGIENYLPSSIPLPDSPFEPETVAKLTLAATSEINSAIVVPVMLQKAARSSTPPQVLAIGSSSLSAPETFSLGSRNLRKVLQKLHQAGFQIFRTRGHHVLKQKEGGASVIVPTHGAELAEGTLRSIESQARAALESKNESIVG